MDEKWTTYSAVLATESAMADAINKDVKRGEGTLRDECDAMVIATYETTGAKSYDLKVEGTKVGTYSVTVSKQKTQTVVSCDDIMEFIAWAEANDCLESMLSIDSRKVSAWFAATGEKPDGVTISERTIPESVSGTTVRISKEFKAEVADRLRNQLGLAWSDERLLEE